MNFIIVQLGKINGEKDSLEFHITDNVARAHDETPCKSLMGK